MSPNRARRGETGPAAASKCRSAGHWLAQSRKVAKIVAGLVVAGLVALEACGTTERAGASPADFDDVAVADGSGDTSDAVGDSAADGAEVEGDAVEVADPVCPPVDDGGTEIGDLLIDFDFRDCADGPVRIRDVCTAEVGLVYSLYGWCPPCWRFVRELPELLEDFGSSLKVIIVIAEDPMAEPATAEYCAGFRDEFGTGAVVAYDPTAALEVYGGAGLTLITAPGARIVFKRDDATHEAVREAIAEQLGR